MAIKKENNSKTTQSRKIENFWDKINTGGFDKNPQNINKNWPIKKNIANIIQSLKSQWYETVTKSDVEETFRILTGLTEESLDLLVEDSENPMLVRVVANYLVRDWRNTWITPIEKILERAIGSVEATGSVKVEMSNETLNFLDTMNKLKNDK